MSPKAATYLFTIVGSTIGSMVPLLWGSSELSFTSLIFGAVGAIAGIYVAFKLTH